MRAFEVEESNVKEFMQHLFAHDTFNDFEVRGIVLSSFTYFEVSGESVNGGYCSWEELRPYVRFILKGQDKPRLMKVVFAKARPEEFNDNAAALFINLVYEDGKVLCTAACSQRNFELSKAMDVEWDAWVEGFFREKGIG